MGDRDFLKAYMDRSKRKSPEEAETAQVEYETRSERWKKTGGKMTNAPTPLASMPDSEFLEKYAAMTWNTTASERQVMQTEFANRSERWKRTGKRNDTKLPAMSRPF